MEPMLGILRRRLNALKKTNDALTTVAVIFSLYLIFYPLFPEVPYFFEDTFDAIYDMPPPLEAYSPYPTNRLVIPIIGVDEEVTESASIKEVHEKVWHRPGTGTPDSLTNKNTVLVAHRYATIGGNRSSTFYHLPKLTAGEEITLWWGNKKYTYRVIETKIVPPTAVEIEAPTDKPILTLYTCTPLWNSTDRFVVIAELIKK